PFFQCIPSFFCLIFQERHSKSCFDLFYQVNLLLYFQLLNQMGFQYFQAIFQLLNQMAHQLFLLFYQLLNLMVHQLFHLFFQMLTQMAHQLFHLLSLMAI
ncbi:MAG: hypothetical protein ACK55Z_17260, partial [bacterium]